MVEGHVFLWMCGFESRSGHKKERQPQIGMSLFLIF
jgi:hypothetical protein